MNSSFPNRWSFSYLKFTKYVTNIIAEPKYKYGQQSPGRDEMRKRNFTSLEVLAEQVRKEELQIFASQGRAEVRKQNFTYLAVKAEGKCRSGTLHFWQSMQNESADVELQIFGSKDRAEAELQIFGNQGRAEVEHQVFGSQGKVEVWKRNFRSLAVKTERKCGSSTADLWQSSQVGRAEADLNIFDRPISYWLSLPMLKNNSTDCYIEGQCEDHVWLKHMTYAMTEWTSAWNWLTVNNMYIYRHIPWTDKFIHFN